MPERWAHCRLRPREMLLQPNKDTLAYSIFRLVLAGFLREMFCESQAELSKAGSAFKYGVTVSTITGKLPVMELALPFPVMVPLPEVGNLISGTAFTIHFFLFLTRAPVQSQTCDLFR
jgi:hypothetical protein